MPALSKPDLRVQFQQFKACTLLCEDHGFQQGSVLHAGTLHLSPQKVTFTGCFSEYYVHQCISAAPIMLDTLNLLHRVQLRNKVISYFKMCSVPVKSNILAILERFLLLIVKNRTEDQVKSKNRLKHSEADISFFCTGLKKSNYPD